MQNTDKRSNSCYELVLDREDTMDFSKRITLFEEEGLEMIQNKVPKLDATTFEARLESLCVLSVEEMQKIPRQMALTLYRYLSPLSLFSPYLRVGPE
jgi:hypothetical protein